MNESAQSPRGTARPGSSRWGYLQVGYARHWVCHRLVVYPPGVTIDDVRWLRAWRVLPFLVIATVLASTAGAAWAGATGLVGLATGFVVAGATLVVVGHRTRRVRAHIRALEAWTGYGSDSSARATRREIGRLAALLREADERLASGAISAVEHEVLWARCYDELPTAGRRRRLNVA